MDVVEYLKEQLSKRNWISNELRERAFKVASEGNLTIEKINEELLKLEQNYYKKFDAKGNKAEYYRISDIFYECNKESVITISCKYKYQEISGDYDVLITPVLNYPYQALKEYKDTFFRVTASDNKIKIKVNFPSEQSYRITVAKVALSENKYLFVEYDVYAVESDLYAMKYLKGDLHCHTTYSDGFEPPEQVVCSARKFGCDFLAITDHNQYKGSEYAENWVKENGGKITVIRGEEYSCDYTPMHILSLGAPQQLDRYNYTVKCIINSDGDTCLDERIKEILDEDKDVHSDPLAFACTQFLFEKIRANGGFSVLCHPMWKPLSHKGNRMDVPLALVEDLIKYRKFDGIEIVSGSRLNESQISNMQHAIATDKISSQDVAYVGITDSHCYSSDPICGKHFTVVFSEDNTAEKIIDGLHNKRSVAVEIDENGKAFCYGQLRYVMFTYFLLDKYFPNRDKEAYEDGENMEKILLCD